MSGAIHPTAWVDEKAVLGLNVQVGPHAVIYGNVQIESDVCIGAGAVIGKKPQLAPSSTVKVEPLPALVIESGVVIGCQAIIMEGTQIGQGALVGDQCFIREHCQIGPQVMIGQGVTIENKVRIGRASKVQSKSYITALTVLEEEVFIAPCVVTTNDNFMGRTEKRHKLKQGAYIEARARVGGGVIILPGKRIGKEAFIGAGAVVTKDVPAQTVYVGNPARKLKDVPQEELLS